MNAAAGAAMSPESVRAQLDRILASPGFQKSARVSRFLRFVVECGLAGDGPELKEYILGVEVMDRGAGFDPRTDSIVRVEASRVRAKLRQYYAAEGANDPIEIELPVGSYTPVFRKRPIPPPRLTLVPSGKLFGLRWRGTGPALAVATIGLTIYLGIFAARPAIHLLARQPGAEPASVAVLPFVVLNPDKDTEYFGDGLVDQLIDKLTKSGGPRVAAHTSVFQFKGKDADVRRVGAQLNVRMVIEGTVTMAGARLRVTAKLIDVTSGYTLWSETYNRPCEERLQALDDISRSIVRDIRIKQVGKGNAFPSGERGLEAYRLYLAGRRLARAQDEASIRESIERFREATLAQPDCAPAFAGLAHSYALLAFRNAQPPGQVMPKAGWAARKALDLDDMLPEAHSALGMVNSLYEWDWAAARREFERALALDPEDPDEHEAYALYYLLPKGRLAEALAQLRQAESLDPSSPQIQLSLGTAYHFEREFDRAIERYRRSLDLDPRSTAVHEAMGAAYLQKSMIQEALASFEDPSTAAAGPVEIALLGCAYALEGDAGAATRLLEELRARSKREYVPSYYQSLVYIALGDKSAALQCLERARAERCPLLVYLKVKPLFDSLRPDPRFGNLVGNLGLRD